MNDDEAFAWWHVEWPMKAPLYVCCSPPRTLAEAKADYKGAVVRPMAEDEVRAWMDAK